EANAALLGKRLDLIDLNLSGIEETIVGRDRMAALNSRQIRKQPRVQTRAEQSVERRCIRGGAERDDRDQPVLWTRVLRGKAGETRPRPGDARQRRGEEFATRARIRTVHDEILQRRSDESDQ